MPGTKNKLKLWILNIIILNIWYQNAPHSAVVWYNDQGSNIHTIRNNSQGYNETTIWNNDQNINNNILWNTQDSNGTTKWSNVQVIKGTTIWNNDQVSNGSKVWKNDQRSNAITVWNNVQYSKGTILRNNGQGSKGNKAWKNDKSKNDTIAWNNGEGRNGTTIFNTVQRSSGITIWNIYKRENRTIMWSNGTKEQLPVTLPECMNITVTFSDYVKSSVNDFLQLNIGYDTDDWITQWTLSPDNTTVSLCYPLSPQMLQCNTRRLASEDYRIQNYSLYRKDGQFLAVLGDYYVDDQATAYACHEPISSGAMTTRCHYMTLASSDYETRYNGDLYIKKAELVLHRPRFSTATDNSTYAKLCYPLNVTLLNCDAQHRLITPPFRYNLRHNLELYYLFNDVLVALGDYRYVSDDGEVELCMKPSVIYRILVVAMFVSDVCMVLSLVCQLVEGSQVSHRKCLMYHSACFAVCSIWSTFQRCSNYRTMSYVVKYTAFTIGYLGVIGAAVWLFMAGYDVCRTFANLGRGSALFINGRKERRFLVYSIIGWGTPIVLTTVVLTINFSPSLQMFLHLNLQLGTSGWFHDHQTSYVFYFTPLLVLCCINECVFFKTIYHIRKAGSGTELVNNRRKRLLLRVSFKLSIVMGVFWIIECILWIARSYTTLPLHCLSHGLVILHGIALFLLTSFNKETLKVLQNKFEIMHHRMKMKLNL